MPTFLQQVAKKISDEHGSELRDVCIVLPSKRAATYLRRELSGILQTSHWSPKYFTMQDLFAHFSQYEPLDPTDALFALYAAYQQVKGQQHAEDLGSFLSWGSTLMRDMNDVDNYLLDPIPFFTDLTNIKNIEEWSFGMEHLTDEQQRFTKLWQEQGEIYLEFKKQNHKNGVDTYGGMGRDIHERLDMLQPADLLKKYWFVGLNALSKSESTLIKKLVSIGKAECLWDADKHYFDNPIHEAGDHLRINKKEPFGQPFQFVNSNFTEDVKDIEAISVPSDVGQIQAACSILNSLNKAGAIDRTAVVLPDRQLLIPLIMNLPEEIDQFNITMGVPLDGSPAFELLSSMISTHEKRIAGNDEFYYYKNVRSILHHPLLLKSYDPLNVVYLPSKAYLLFEELKNLGTNEIDDVLQFFEPINEVQVILNGAIRMFKGLIDQEKLHQVEQEFVIQTLALMDKVLRIVQSGAFVKDLRTLHKLMKFLVRQQDVSFIGEPMKGLQIMGSLETRAIDHENIIYLSMNEGSMPQEDRSNSFIPYDLRIAYGLPIKSDSASVQAYNFYRSIQRSNKTYLIWKNDGASTNSGGASRFLAQIEHELAKLPTIDFKKIELKVAELEAKTSETKVIKTPQVQQKIKELLSTGLSPSAMTTYVRCPLDFYYKYVLRLRSPDDTLTNLDTAQLGTIVHNSAEELLLPYIGTVLKPKDLTSEKKSVDRVVRKILNSEYPHMDLNRGQDLLHFEIIKKFLNDYLDREAERCAEAQTKLEALELPLEAQFDVEYQGTTIAVSIKGKADRLDRNENGALMIDLKSGRLQSSELKISDMSDALNERKTKVLQLLTYAWLFHKSNSSINNVSAGIFPFSNSKRGLVEWEVLGNSTIGKDELDHFESALKELVRSMLDERTIIQHNEGNEFCEFCLKQ